MSIPVMVALEGNASGLTSALGSANGAMSSFGGSAQEMGTKVGQALASMNAILTGLGIASIKAAADFETTMMQVYTSSNITKQGLADITSGVKELSTTVGYSANELGNAMRFVVSSGYSGRDAVEVLRASAEGAKLGIGDLGQTAKALSTIMYDLHLPADQAVSSMSQLLAAVRIGQVEMSDMSTAMANVMPVATSAGIGLTEVAAAMAVMTAQGTPAVNAGTQLRMTLMQLQRITPHAAEAMANFGLSATDVSTKLGERGLSGTLQLLTTAIDQKLGTALSGMDKQLSQIAAGSLEDFQAGIDALPESQRVAVGALADMLGGVKSLQGAIQLTGSHTKDFENAIKAVGDAGKDAGTDLSKWGDMSETMGVKWENFKNQLKMIAIEIGEAFLPAAKKIVDALDRVANWFKTNPWAIKAALIVIGTAMAFTATVALILAAAMFMLLLPFLLVGAAILGVVLGIRYLIQHFDAVKHAATTAFNAVVDAAIWMWHSMVSVMSQVWNAFYTIWTRIVAFLWSVGVAISDAATMAWNSLYDIVTSVLSSIGDFVISVWNSIWNFLVSVWNSITSAASTAWNSVWNFIKDALNGAWNSVVSIGASIIDAVTNCFSSALGAASGFVGSFTSVGADIIHGVWNGVMSMASSLASAAASVVRGALNAAKAAIGISSPSKDFHEQVGMPIVQGISRGIEAARPMIDRAIADAVQGPLSGDYQFNGKFSAGNFGGSFQGSATARGQGTTININADFSGNFYGTGGARQAAIDIQRELLRMQQSQDLGFLATARRQLGV